MIEGKVRSCTVRRIFLNSHVSQLNEDIKKCEVVFEPNEDIKKCEVVHRP